MNISMKKGFSRKKFDGRFLGAKAPLGLVRVSESVTNKKVGNFKIS